MRRPSARLAAAALCVAAAAALASCTAAQPHPPASASPAQPGAGQPTTAPADPSAKPTPAGDPTCTGILPATTVDAFTKAGWTSRPDPFYVGNVELPGGIQCTWGDAKVASDQVQVYGWAPTTPDLAAAAEKELVDSGWRRFTESGATYVTATGDMIMNPDAAGFGMTYRFTDGQVALADTKQGLLLVEWPPQ